MKSALIASLDTFTRAYLACALWSSNDESNESGGESFDANYSIDDLALEALQSAIADCTAFQQDNAQDLAESELTSERAGHNFWLNRVGHGSGFWDEYGGNHPLRAVCNRLSDASKGWSNVDLYLGDDGQIYSS